MANKSVFASKSVVPDSNAVNEAGGAAYPQSLKGTLASVVCTGVFQNTFYSTANEQLDCLKKLVDDLRVQDDQWATYVAKLAVYARHEAYLKDIPAYLCAYMFCYSNDRVLNNSVFNSVIDNGRMLRNVVQIIRSGQLPKKSINGALKTCINNWLLSKSPRQLLTASIGNDPSLRDVFRLSHPKPQEQWQNALFGWVVGSTERYKYYDLPNIVKEYVQFHEASNEAEQLELLLEGTEVSKLRWDMLASSAKGEVVWTELAKGMGTQALRMNLNTLQRHGVFNDKRMVEYVIDQLSDEAEILSARQFPYQYYTSHQHVNEEVPQAISKALSDAIEISMINVPEFDEPVVIGIDTSGSMQGRPLEIAALFTAAILRKNPDSIVVPFDTRAYQVKIDPYDTLTTITKTLYNYCGGGTDCGEFLRYTNNVHKDRKLGGAILVSDNQGWFDASGWGYGGGGTPFAANFNDFQKIQRHNGIRNAKAVCINVSPCGTAQVPSSTDALNVSGFSDSVFKVCKNFLSGESRSFVDDVETIEV